MHERRGWRRWLARLLDRERASDDCNGEVENLAAASDELRALHRGADAAPVMIWMAGADRQTIYVNRPWLEFTGRTLAEELGDGWTRSVHPEDLERCRATYALAFEAREELAIDFRLRRCDGEYRWIFNRGAPRFATSGELLCYIGSCLDITERKLVEEQLAYNALHDGLTDLPNRTLFLDRLSMAMRRAARRESSLFAVLFIDLDLFKLINDSLGHMLGDQVLVAFAGRLRESLRPGDTVARLGGDEFAVLLEDLLDEGHAARIARRIQEGLETPFELGGNLISTPASIGIALSSLAYQSPEEMLCDADTAMYQAKSEGRSRFAVFVPPAARRG